MTYKVLDLFSGIGGFSLGLEKTGGFETVAFCEIEEFPRKVLAKHWLGVPIYPDIRDLTADTLGRDGIAVDVICGGFPCQDLSFAGKRAGLEGARSGLWKEYARIIGELRPRYVIVENVPGLLSLGMGTVLGDLAALRYDAIWDCIPASAVGAPHRRDRVWIVAYTKQRESGKRCVPDMQWRQSKEAEQTGLGGCNNVAHTASKRRTEARPNSEQPAQRVASGSYVSDSREAGLPHNQGRTALTQCNRDRTSNGGRWPHGEHDHWSVEPDVGRVAHGVPARVDRLKALGNAVVPQIPEIIGRAILAAEARR